MAGIPGTGSAVAIVNDASTLFNVALTVWGMFDQARERLRKRREQGEQLTAEEQAVADMTDEQAFANLKARSFRFIDHGEQVRDKHQAAIDEEQRAANEEQAGRER
jgi:hypothetical protein